MDPTDAFFTQTVVGSPFTVMLGRRLNVKDSTFQGLEHDLATGESSFTRLWQEWIVLSHEEDKPGLPRKRPGALRRWLERHALWVAGLGLSTLVATAVFWGLMLWK
jgi:hypothetical protein